MPADEISALAQAAAARAGFDRCGIAALSAARPDLEYFSEWIAAGRAGEMEYLKAGDQAGRLKRASPDSTAPWARSVLVCALNYDCNAPYSTDVARNKSRGWIARYACSREDYHSVVLRKLRQLEAELLAAHPHLQTRCYVDTGPHLERAYARNAGVGWMGKNTCIINEQLGSWLFLGIILLSAELAPALPAPDRCGACRRCLDACPTQALTAPYQMDASRCISYLTIEKRGAIPEQFRSAIGNNVFGCDICQDVCPWNSRRQELAVAQPSGAPELQPRPALVNPALDRLAALTPEDFSRVFQKSPVKRARYSGFRRNVAVALGNSGDPAFIPQLESIAKEEDALVAEHARWALVQINRAAS